MNYCLFKLNFSTPLHIGDSSSARSLETQTLSLCADTLFSALCHAAPGKIDMLSSAVKSDKLLISDAFPFKKDVLYVPKPCMLPQNNRQSNSQSSAEKKKMKKLKYIPVSMLDDFFRSIKGEKDFSPDNADNDFGKENVVTRVGIRGNDEPEPYSVASYSFNQDCGLYFIACSDDNGILETLKSAVAVLGLEGVGGKISSGYGKFACTPCAVPPKFKEMLCASGTDYISLTSSLPGDDELETAMDGAYYSMIRRGGFVYSPEIGETVKKETQFFFASGSVFKTKYKGALYNVYKGGKHPVYRYAKPIFMGVSI